MKKKKYLIGIETTAHTFGVGIIDENFNIVSNLKDVFTTERGGIVPSEAAEHHKKVSYNLFQKSLKETKISEEEIIAIAFSDSPGLAPCLSVGTEFTKKLAKKLKIPIVGVNHCIAHLEIGEICGSKDPVLLYVSGANTQIIAYEGKKYRVFGETLDLGVGNFIDCFAREVGIGFPGGPKIEELAKKGKKYIELPYSIKGMDISFSGILTKLIHLKNKGEKIEDLSFSMQETIFSMLVEASERAIAHLGKKELVLGGGVACNSRLQEMCRIMCEERGCKLFIPEKKFLVDNGAMIAYLGLKMFKRGIFYKPSEIDKVDFNPKKRTDMVDVLWK
ncbi:MAG: bifunctional N(6)-L-threonylcarbamoyladenine synthase/serine/threonine protein kinase [Candidatus Pacearchaeota archaeon]